MRNQQTTLTNSTDSIHYTICTSCSGEMTYLCDWPGNGTLRCLQCGKMKTLQYKNSNHKTSVA